MAILLDLKTNRHIYLFAHHNFGRLAHVVDTQVEGPLISKHHMSITWQDEYWQIRDFSRNGTWLNQQKLEPHQLHPLAEGDEIFLAEHHQARFKVIDIRQPCDLLLPLDANSHQQAIYLDKYHLLPNETQPEVAVYNDNQQWFVDYLTAENHKPMPLDENDTIEFGGNSWQLFNCQLAQPTEIISGPQYSLEQLKFMFELSLDEEYTSLEVQTPDEQFNLDTRIHHYLTLNLARHRAADAAKGLTIEHQGWLYPQLLMKDLGVDYCHLNILIHRARKQFSDSVNVVNGQNFIERHNGKLRFGGTQFTIHKDHQTECELLATG